VIDSDDVWEALRLWHGAETDKWPLAHLRLGLQIDLEQADYGSLAQIGPAAQNRAILNRALEVLRMRAPSAEDLLRQRFEHQRDVLDLAHSLNVTDSSIYYRQRVAVNSLTEIIIGLEEKARATWQERMSSRLELPTYTTLVGVEEPYKTIMDVLKDESAQSIIAIDGLGGLGKTALADKVVRDLIHTTDFDEIAWITAKQTHLSTLGRLKVDTSRPALTFPMLIDQLAEQFELNDDGRSRLEQQRLVKNFLQNRTCLVVIDNLETMADYDTLLPELKRWQRPSKFLLTSRLRMLDELDVFSYSLKELSHAATIELMLMEAARTNFIALLQADKEDLIQIYKAIGGNPMAIKLVIGQARFYSLPQVLKRFAQKQEQEDLFKYIYLDAWESLSDASKTVLLTLTEAGEGGFTFEHLHHVSDLPEEDVQIALERLILLSLVDLGGTLMERRYRLHRLTEVFILGMLA
jgi:hypothetical protein